MLKFIPLAAMAVFASVAIAQSQSTPATTVEPTAPATTVEPAANAVDTSKKTAPEAGANSFTESQARSRLEKNGFLAITGLMKDSDGIWRGKAMKDGKSMDVALDYKGVISAN